MKNPNYVLIYITLFSLISCVREKTEAEIARASDQTCFEKWPMTCTSDTTGGLYFSCKLDGRDYCLVDGVDGYRGYVQTYVSGVSTVDDPTFNASDATGIGVNFSFGDYKSKETKPFFTIRSTPIPFDIGIKMPFSKLIDTVLLVKNLPVSHGPLSTKRGYAASIAWFCNGTKDEVPPYGVASATINTGHKKQDSGAKFTIEYLKKTTTSTEYIYDLIFHVECQMFREDTQPLCWLRDGVFKTRFAVPREE